MSAEAALDGDQRDHARCSPIRKTYLYLALFAGVIGAMVSAWGTLSPFFDALFGSSQASLRQDTLRNLAYLAIFLAFLAYHWAMLRADGRAAARALAERQSRFAVLVTATEQDFLSQARAAVQRHAAHVPVTGLLLVPGVPEIEPGEFQSVVLPASLAINPSPELRAWPDAFQSERLVPPTAADGWAWVGSAKHSQREWAEQITHAVRLRAEGMLLRAAPVSSRG